MFAFTHQEINVTELRQRMSNNRAGAFAAFEGRVRDHNDGRQVKALAYEAYEELGVKEGQRIVSAAVQKFALVEALCIHRLGPVPIGEVAVWVGVLSEHRGEAFDACRVIIDEVKHQLPIWKKEEYLDGTAEWVNCQACASPPPDQSVMDCTPANAAGEELPWELDVLSLSRGELQEFELVDLRKSREASSEALKQLLGAKICSISLSLLSRGDVPLDAHRKYLFVCESGDDSRKMVDQLRMRGCENVFFVSGGMQSIRRKFIA